MRLAYFGLSKLVHSSGVANCRIQYARQLGWIINNDADFLYRIWKQALLGSIGRRVAKKKPQTFRMISSVLVPYGSFRIHHLYDIPHPPGLEQMAETSDI